MAVFRSVFCCWDLFKMPGDGLLKLLLLLEPLEAPGGGLQKYLLLLGPLRSARLKPSKVFSATGTSSKCRVAVLSVCCYWGLFKMLGGGLKCLLLLGPLQNAGWQSSEVFLLPGPLRSARLQSSEVFSVTVSSSKCRVAVFRSVFYCWDLFDTKVLLDM